MKWKVAIFVFWVVCSPLLVSADYLEVRRDANVYKQPNSKSEKLAHLEVKGREGPYLVRLVDDAKVNGFYKIRLPGKSTEGWIYKTYVRRQPEQPTHVPYKRTLYRHWIDEDGDCQNTRMEILIRDDDDGKVEFKGNEQCDVLRGTWLDPYTGETFREAKLIDVDHVVPLKNAHDSGAWAWTAEKRREYANYLTYNKHLLAVKASENRKKGEKGPDRYMPPRKAYHCEYVQIWVKIKEDWELEMTEAEGEAVQKILGTCP